MQSRMPGMPRNAAAAPEDAVAQVPLLIILAIGLVMLHLLLAS